MKLILRSFRCLLLWIVILSRAFRIAMVMIYVIVVDVIGVISRSTGLFRRWDHTLWGLERVAFILQAAREIALIEDHMCGSKDCVGGAYKQEISLIARGNTDIRKLGRSWHDQTYLINRCQHAINR